MAFERTVCPENIMALWVSYADMPRETLDKAFSGPMSECGCHVLQLPLSLGSHVVKLGDASQPDITMRYGRER
jgi:hypothetical protein